MHEKRWLIIRFTLTYRWCYLCWPVGVLGTWEEAGKTSDKEVRWEKFRKESLLKLTECGDICVF